MAVSTTKTQRELVDQALANLGILAAGQTPSAEDVARMDAYVVPMFEMLEARELVEVDKYDEIPTAWFLALADKLAGLAAPDFGFANDPRIILNADRADRVLMEMVATKPTYLPLRTEYF